ncbi:DUF3426 domain-containing protein [Cellvibrio sp. OA-2007]|uniref:DUF3426 domain-containing protein n=1 Tax=Cellvibrio sp. OA-2007 TaxID=529823 RepID=UPI000781D121|nr:DUF3426 domain-containing protein [Cellvibrio sp. OA-2007]
MTSASNQMITRCPKCGTAFRVTPSQLQSAKGAVRCGSCLHVFKAQEYVAATPAKNNTASSPSSIATAKPSVTAAATKTVPAKTPPTTKVTTQTQTPASKSATATAQPAILSAIKPLPVEPPKASVTATPATKPAAAKPVMRTIKKSPLDETDDLLISDDMDDSKTDNTDYEFDGFIDIGSTPKAEVSLFERKISNKDTSEDPASAADESWAEMLIDDEDDTPQLGLLKPKTDEQLADDALFSSHAVNTESELDAPVAESPAPAKASTPGLIFSLVGEKEEQIEPQSKPSTNDDFILSDELANIPSNQGFNQANTTDIPDPSIFETPDDNSNEDSDTPKRQVKTQPKIRAYDGSRTALLMNIIPAPIEFNAKRMRRWYQRKLWPSLSALALVALLVQVGWFKFDYFSRVEPYRTGYLFLCPYLGCEVPTLVDTSRIIASNLVVREHPEAEGALAVDVMLINGAPFDQPFPDLLLVFTDIDNNQVAARRFIPKDYLGGELVGRELMPQNQKVHISLDLVDPGAEAVNYHISIPQQ